MSNNIDLMKETVESVYDYIPQVVGGIEVITTNIQGGREDKAMLMCTDLIDGLNWILEALTLTRPLQEEYSCIISVDQVQSLFGEIVEAFENRDYVMLGDVLNYELPPVLGEWQVILQELLLKIGEANGSNN